jgi:hypothetical protein
MKNVITRILITCGVGAIVEIMVLLRKLKATSNSSSNSLIFLTYSKILVSSTTMGAFKASGST